MLVEVVFVDGLTGQEVGDGEPGPQVQRRRDLAELQVEVHQAHALTGLCRQVAGEVGGVERLAAAAARRGDGEDLGELCPLDDDPLRDDRQRRRTTRL
jgi:hypothetical protein